ncbi:MAG: hypothetical protein ACK4TA_15860 [Saprospiraceae bacterium]
MKKIIILIGMGLALAACKQDNNQQSNGSNESGDAAAAAPTVSTGSGELKLTCESNGSETNVPNNSVYAIAGERKTKLMDITAACMEVKPENYASYGIPTDAVAALGSWFAGLGDYFYAKQEGDKIVVYHTAISEEGPPNGIHTYYKIATYENGKITVHEETPIEGVQ